MKISLFHNSNVPCKKIQRRFTSLQKWNVHFLRTFNVFSVIFPLASFSDFFFDKCTACFRFASTFRNMRSSQIIYFFIISSCTMMYASHTPLKRSLQDFLQISMFLTRLFIDIAHIHNVLSTIRDTRTKSMELPGNSSDSIASRRLFRVDTYDRIHPTSL